MGTALAEDPVIVLRTHNAGLTTMCNVSSRGIRCSFRALQVEEGVGKGAITIYRMPDEGHAHTSSTVTVPWRQR